jgi:substrate import-associated zinc metallohydrolase lipoprotein
MKLFNKFSFIGCLLLAMASCNKEEDLNLQQPVGLGGDVTAQGPVDKWLKDSLTTPYNIAVKYRWDPWELSLDKTLTPPDESKIIAAMSAIKRVWIDPYNAETGSELFIKKYSPKQFVLVGSVEYNFGTVIAGQAEGGNNITFFDVNQNFFQDKGTSVKEMLHTAHHEFAHILHQNVLYPQEYKSITVNKGLPGFTATWFNVSDKQAHEWGYITPYSMASSDEDFVEMISIMLMEGRSRFNELLLSITSVAGREALQEKERAIVDYFQRIYNINFYSLQTRVQAALKAVVPPPPVPAVDQAYGFGKQYTTASFNPANTLLQPQPAAFMNIYNSSKNAVAALPYGLTMDSIAFIQSTATRAVLRIYLGQAGGVFAGDFTYTVTKGANNLYTYTYLLTNGNGNLISAAVAPLVNYFRNNQFAITWYADPISSNYPRIQFTPQATPGTFFIARLLP